MDESELYKILIMAEGFCKDGSCGLCHDALKRAIKMVADDLQNEPDHK